MYFKAFTHDLRSPLQGGEPVWDGKLPFTLPEVKVDTSSTECAAGWNATHAIADCLRIAGFWRAPWPMRVFSVAPNGHEIIERKDKVRSTTWNIEAECTIADIEAAIHSVSTKWFSSSKLESDMAHEQIAWYKAFASVTRDEIAVTAGLNLALKTRGLDWKLQKFEAARDAWDAWAARDARDAWDAWAAWAAWDARAAWAAWAARDARDARDAWDAWAARDARDAWDAWDALTVYFAATMKWTQHDPLLLTTGIRDAFASGLLLAIPTVEHTLGYVMKP